MDELNRIRVLIYQYTMFKTDYYEELAVQATRKLQTVKCLSASEYQKIYRDLLTYEIFDTMATDLLNLIK